MTPSTIGRYEIKSELGRGGMASVYYAYDPRFKRDVAIKVLPREFLHDPMFQARFQREAETIATLEHSTIVPVYDFGEEDGQPYLVMRYMPGGSLGDRIKNGPMSLAEAARIVERLASALDEAHTKGIIHRDLKPGNILFDQRNDSYLSDFGIVKLSQQATDGNLTGEGVVGTPAYMSPEQARAESEIDGRSDVYALGTILFEMLAGHQPFRAETPIGLILKHLSDPVPSILALQPDLPEDIDAVIEKALAKERDRRYQTAGDLARAVNAVVHGQSVDDIPYATLPIPIPAVTPPDDSPLTMPGVPGAPAATRKHQAEATLEHEIGAATPKRRTAKHLIVGGAVLGVAIIALGVFLLLTSRGSLGQSQVSIVSPSYAAPIAGIDAAKARLGRGTLNVIALSPDGQHIAVGGGVGVYLHDSRSFEQEWVGQVGSPVSSLAFSPDGQTLAAGLDNGHLFLINASDGTLIHEGSPHSGQVTGVAWSPDGKRIATSSTDSTLSLIDPATGDTLASRPGHKAEVFSVAFSPDGKHLISGSKDKTAIIWETDVDLPRPPLVGHSDTVFDAAFSPDGKTAVTASLDGTLIVWDAANGNIIHIVKGPGEGLVSVAFSPDGTLIASGGANGALVTWNARQNTQVATLNGHSGWVKSLAWMSGGRNLVSGSFDNTVIVWDVGKEQAVRTLTGYTDYVTAVAMGPVVATGTGRGEVVLWDSQTLEPQFLPIGHDLEVNGLAFSPGGSQLASVSDDRTLIVWDVESSRNAYVLRDHPGRVTAIAFNAGGARLATASCAEADSEAGCKGGQIRLWIAATGQPVGDPLVGHTDVITALAWMPKDVATLISGSADETLISWDTATGKTIRTFGGHTAAVNSVAVDPSGTWIASGANDSKVIIWDAASAAKIHTLVGHSLDVNSVAFSPDGRWLASGSDDGTVIVWDVAQGKQVKRLRGHNAGVLSVAWSPDGKLILSGSMDGTAILWNAPGDAETG